MTTLLRLAVVLLLLSLVACATAPTETAVPDDAIGRVALRLVPPYRMDLADDTLFDNQLLVNTVLGTLQDRDMVHPDGTRAVIVEVGEAGAGGDPADDFIRGGFALVDETTGETGPTQPLEIRYDGPVNIDGNQRLALMFQAIGEEVATRMGPG